MLLSWPSRDPWLRYPPYQTQTSDADRARWPSGRAAIRQPLPNAAKKVRRPVGDRLMGSAASRDAGRFSWLPEGAMATETTTSNLLAVTVTALGWAHRCIARQGNARRKRRGATRLLAGLTPLGAQSPELRGHGPALSRRAPGRRAARRPSRTCAINSPGSRPAWRRPPVGRT
jgi:hypothetical protein